MRAKSVFLLMFFAASVANAEERCISPEFDCLKKGGKWRGGICWKTEIKVKTRWKTKTKTRLISAPPIFIKKDAPAPSVVVNTSQKNQQTLVVPKFVAEKITEKLTKKPLVKKEKWWWTGLGGFALGLWMTEEKSVLLGAQWKTVFAISDRFRVSGSLGYGFWQTDHILAGASFDVRLIPSLFLSFSFDSLWGDFESFGVIRSRALLVGSGLAYWIGDRVDLSLRFLFGTKKQITNCDSPENLVGGNIFTVNFYF